MSPKCSSIETEPIPYKVRIVTGPITSVLPVHPFENTFLEFQATCDPYVCRIHVDLDRQS